jgi:PilZ domain
MGAVPASKGGEFAAVSLRHEAEPQTIGIVSSTGKPGPHRFARVPTYTVGVAHERRDNPRAALPLALRLTRVGEVSEPYPVTLVTRNISSSGIFFLAPREFAKGQSVELEVALIERPQGQGSVQMFTAAHIVRCEETDMPGWRGYAATFDDFAIKRDDVVPMRYRAH